MSVWPTHNQDPWDDDLRAYIDGQDAAVTDSLAAVATSGSASDLGGSPLPVPQIPVGAVIGIVFNDATSTWPADPAPTRTDVLRIYSGGDASHVPTAVSNGDLWAHNAV